MIINNNSAPDKYVFIANLMSCHFLYNKLTVTSLPISRLDAMIITDRKLPANSSPIPFTEKYAALPAISNATVNISSGNILILIFNQINKYLYE